MENTIKTEIKDKPKPGFKLTKLGWIPEDWNLIQIKEFGTVITGNTPPTNDPDNYNGDYLFVTPGDIGHSKIITKSNIRISKKGFELGRKNDIGSVLFVCIGSTIGKAAIAGKDLITNQQINSIILNENNHAEYLYYQLCFHKKRIKRVAGHQAVPIINKSTFERISIFHTDLPEQQKIAQILSTWDKTIEKIEQLIRVKTQLKKGLMQQLLTGKKRFREFEGEEWEEYVLGTLGKTFNGLSGKSKDDFGSGYPYIPYLNIINNSRVNPDQMDFVSISSNEKQNEVKYGDIFFTTSSETPEEAGMPSVLLDDLNKTFLNSFCFGFRLYNFNTLDPSFARFYFRSYMVRKEIFRLAQGSTRYNISKNEIVKIKFLLPSIMEQKKIATFLSGVEDEIRMLDKRLGKFNEQKKGLMQKLLTGKVRVKID